MSKAEVTIRGEVSYYDKSEGGVMLSLGGEKLLKFNLEDPEIVNFMLLPDPLPTEIGEVFHGEVTEYGEVVYRGMLFVSKDKHDGAYIYFGAEGVGYTPGGSYEIKAL